jgi:hypothetical protein
VCFACICSFKRDESADSGHQVLGNWKERYKIVLDGKNPEDFDLAPDVDAPWYVIVLYIPPEPAGYSP